ncbi:MAG: response regulator, partial [Muribaculaceae bacterium]|nr:response regulator [Muribaculaceae bacterium]
VAHPWYATPWAKALYATAVLVMIWWVVRSYIVRMRHKAELLDLTHAEQINEARLQSFVNISHEIRTPMSLVISPLQKLLATDTDPSRRHDYGLILRNAKRILRLIDELMDLRKIEKRQMRLTLAPTELVPLINDLCDTFAQAVTAKNISLKFDFDASDTVACVDVVNFDKILMNLFSNAVKYNPEGGNIDGKLSEDSDDVEISVTDTGIGVSDEDKELIFERFYQARGNTAGGTGVGLHLTKQLVLLHGGTIVATDNPCGCGTCFTVRIPKGDVESARDAMKERIPGVQHVRRGTPLSDPKELLVPDPVEMPVDAGKSRSHRVLVVEDDAEIRRYLVAELSGKYRVTAATNGKEALDSIFAKAPDVIVSDIMMPVMDGIELTRIIKGNINLNHIPVMLITAMTRDEDNISALDAGADDFVTKPFNIEVVRSKIAGLIERYRRLKNLYSGSQDQDDKIDKIAVAGNDEKLMARVMAVLNREMSNTELTVEMLASEVGLSRVHLHRRLKAITNQSPRDFIRNTRLRQAAVLLSEKRLNVAETADLTGFSNAGSFTTSFKKLFGVTPSEYADRNKVLNANS